MTNELIVPRGFEVVELTTTAPCAIHSVHTPVPRINQQHHWFPQWLQLIIWGEVRVKATTVVCPTGHVNVHDLINHRILHGEFPGTHSGSTYKLAFKGFSAFTDNGGDVATAAAHLRGGGGSE